MTPISKQFLSDFLAETQSKAHHLYALMAGLPKANFYFYRFYDNTNNTKGCNDPERNTFSLHEFYTSYEAFHPEDDFGIYFSVHLDRIDSLRAEEYTDSIHIYRKRDATVRKLTGLVKTFLEGYCEKCLRDNRPFELTPEIISRFGFTPQDVDPMRKLLNPNNTAARKLIRAEYDALCALDFIRLRTR